MRTFFIVRFNFNDTSTCSKSVTLEILPLCPLMLQKHLLKQGNREQNPLDFLSQENADCRLLIIIKNKDIAGHIHKVNHPF